MDLLRVAVVGCGNPLAGDDGVGPGVLAELARRREANEFHNLELELIDAGTGGLDLIEWLLDRDRVIIIDAVLAGGFRGEVLEFSAGVLPDPDGLPLSPHQIDLTLALAVARRLYPRRMPASVSVVGIEVGDAPEGDGFRMAPEVRGAVGPACDRVICRLRAWSGEASAKDA